MILELKGIYKDYIQGKMVVPVLKDVSFSMEEGEYVAIMGPSGSGKSTLMNIIGCLDQATSGSFYLDGQDISKCSENEMSDIRLHKIGFVFQSYHLLARQTALANVEIPLVYAKVPKKQRRERALKALERVGLSDRVNFTPNQLSGGQMQRVAIARAMVNNPKLLLADEPTGALDSKSGAQIMDLLEKLNQEGVSVLMITHDSEIASHAKRIVLIRDGELHEPEKNTETDNTPAAAAPAPEENAPAEEPAAAPEDIQEPEEISVPEQEQAAAGDEDKARSKGGLLRRRKGRAVHRGRNGKSRAGQNGRPAAGRRGRAGRRKAGVRSMRSPGRAGRSRAGYRRAAGKGVFVWVRSKR